MDIYPVLDAIFISIIYLTFLKVQILIKHNEKENRRSERRRPNNFDIPCCISTFQIIWLDV